jgi:uncharacterized protein YjbI with pentapeptide repeats
MKITTQQIQNIIKEELDKLLYEEENNDVLRKAIEKKYDDLGIKYYDQMRERDAERIFRDALWQTTDSDLEKYLRTETGIKTRIEMLFAIGYEFSKQQLKDAKLIADYPLDSGTKEKREFIINKRIEEKDFHLLNLENADLRKANLKGANLRASDLDESDLSNVNLSGADLERAKLYNANLSNSILTGANLQFAKMRGANLSKADLSGANLRWARLQDVKLNDAILTNVRYNDRTRWPEGFDPEAAGAVKVYEE